MITTINYSTEGKWLFNSIDSYSLYKVRRGSFLLLLLSLSCVIFKSERREIRQVTFSFNSSFCLELLWRCDHDEAGANFCDLHQIISVYIVTTGYYKGTMLRKIKQTPKFRGRVMKVKTICFNQGLIGKKES